MDTKKKENIVSVLCEKATKALDASNAMKFSQAALNAANAFCSLAAAVKQEGK